MRHDVFRNIFKGKGRNSRHVGCQEFSCEDFSRCQVPIGWDKYIDHLGDGKEVHFPVLAKPFLHSEPKSFTRAANGQMNLLPQYYTEKVKICFSTTAYTVMNIVQTALK